MSFHPGLSFNNSEYSISVKENVPVGTEVIDLGSEITGLFNNDNVRFFITAADITACSINQDTGVISVAQSLDYETQQLYTFPVTVRGSFQLSDEADVRIMVLDVNDNAPIFDQAIYNTILPFDDLGQWSFTVTATDADSEENGEIVYSIIGGNDDGFFTINPNSGEIRVEETTTFDPEIYSRFDLTVQASNPTGSSPGDGTGQGQGLAIVQIDVEASPTPSPSTTTTAAPDETTTYFSTPESLADFSQPSFAEATLHIQRGMKPLACTLLPSLALLLSILAALGMDAQRVNFFTLIDN